MFSTQVIDGETVYMPTREQLESLEVGDMAPDCYGRMAEVTEINHKGDDVNGRFFCHFYTKSGTAGGSISNGIKEGRPVAAGKLSAPWAWIVRNGFDRM